MANFKLIQVMLRDAKFILLDTKIHVNSKVFFVAVRVHISAHRNRTVL